MIHFLGHILLVERDIFFLDKLHEQSVMAESPFIVAKTMKDAITILKRPQNRIQAIFLSWGFGKLECTSFAESLKEKQIDLPLYLLIHAPWRPQAPEEMAKMPFLKDQIIHPQGFNGLMEVVERLFPDKHRWEEIKPTSEPKGKELQLKEEDFVAIDTRNFLLTDKCYFNIFIRLAKDKFVKILSAGDPFDEEFAKKYKSRKVEALWVPKSEHKHYLNLVEQTARDGLGEQNANAGKVIAHLGDNVVKALTQVGIDDENLMYADKFLGHTIAHIRDMKMKGEGYRKLFMDLANTDHAAAVAVIAGLLSQYVGLESSKAIKVVGTAALLHDIAIYLERPDFPAELPKKLEGADLALYDRHAREGAEYLAKLGEVDEIVVQAVAQHHDRYNNQGGKATTLVSEIISASDLFCHLVVNDPEARVQDFIDFQLRNFRPLIADGFEALIKKRKMKATS